MDEVKPKKSMVMFRLTLKIVLQFIEMGVKFSNLKY